MMVFFDSTPVDKKKFYYESLPQQNTIFLVPKVLDWWKWETRKKTIPKIIWKLAAKSCWWFWGYSRVMLKNWKTRVIFTGNPNFTVTRTWKRCLPGTKTVWLKMQIDYPDEITITAANADNAVDIQL
jgi:hypothetical protein